MGTVQTIVAPPVLTSARHLHEPGNTHHLAQHFGNPGSNLVSAERYITMMPERGLPSGLFRRFPDLLIALGVDPAAYEASNGYVIGEQGKPPDFVLEIAARKLYDERSHAGTGGQDAEAGAA